MKRSLSEQLSCIFSCCSKKIWMPHSWQFWNKLQSESKAKYFFVKKVQKQNNCFFNFFTGFYAVSFTFFLFFFCGFHSPSILLKQFLCNKKCMYPFKFFAEISLKQVQKNLSRLVGEVSVVEGERVWVIQACWRLKELKPLFLYPKDPRKMPSLTSIQKPTLVIFCSFRLVYSGFHRSSRPF